ncbi:MAG: hydroxymethylglutaryl-CoA lyase [Desulfovibrionaceae bacterium]|jgi:hydroxymethylglutaryl-CoA lyase|nr:hydroxymethylglutaryl-CoA lyase [Desulfovibrionaceae bacterium]
MSDLPRHIEIHEEGPREGFQFERGIYPLDQRVRLVDMLAETGLRQIQVASFVSRTRVPQMADAEQWFARLRPRSGVRYTGLWLSEAGFTRAQATPGISLLGTLYFYASDAFSRQNNGIGAAEMAEQQRQWIARYRQAGLAIEAAYLMTAFGCNLQGRIESADALRQAEDIIELCRQEGLVLPALYLADTVGWAVPASVERLVGALRERHPQLRIGLHLHDTRGSGLANVYAALRLGVDLYDASVAGLGGCPFAGHASGSAGNICTEDLVFMAHEMGIETGVDLPALLEAAREAERIIGHPLAGRVMHAGLLRS